jgi:hypothetical protein
LDIWHQRSLLLLAQAFPEWQAELLELLVLPLDLLAEPLVSVVPGILLRPDLAPEDSPEPQSKARAVPFNSKTTTSCKI